MSKSIDDIWKDYIDNETKIKTQHKVEQLIISVIQDKNFWARGICNSAEEEMVKLGFTLRQSGNIQYRLMNIAKGMYDKLLKEEQKK
jgi:hypothetical protein